MRFRMQKEIRKLAPLSARRPEIAGGILAERLVPSAVGHIVWFTAVPARDHAPMPQSSLNLMIMERAGLPYTTVSSDLF